MAYPTFVQRHAQVHSLAHELTMQVRALQGAELPQGQALLFPALRHWGRATPYRHQLWGGSIGNSY